MNTFVIPALDLLYARMLRGLTRRQTVLAALLGLALLVNFMFRAACPPERRFFNSPSSPTMPGGSPAAPDRLPPLSLPRSYACRSDLERAMGIEPTTFSLGS